MARRKDAHRLIEEGIARAVGKYGGVAQHSFRGDCKASKIGSRDAG